MGPRISVPEVVREIIMGNRSIYDCLRMDLINYTALAVRIHEEVERQTGGRVNLNTIVVAIKRYADSFEREEMVPDGTVLKDARLSLTDGMLDIRFESGELEEGPAALLEEFSKVTRDYEFFGMAGSFRFLTEDVEDVRRLVGSISGSEKMLSGGLARIKIAVPGNQNRSDVVSYVAETLHRNGIEMVNVFFGSDGIMVIVAEKDASRAYESLRLEIAR